MSIQHPLEECLKTDLATWEIGPYDAALPGPMKLRLSLDGEVVVSAAYETGFLHRGLEKAFEQQPWRAVVAYSDYLDTDGSIFGELAVCLAVEEIARIEVPRRGQYVRVLLSELGRISAHLGYIVRVAKAMNAETIIHYVLRDRERVLDLFELATGARYTLNYLRFGGIQTDITDGFVERVLEVCELFRVRLKEYNDLFTYNHAFLKRTQGLGVLSADRAAALGVTGPNGRASGHAFDVRKAHPYSGYDLFDFAVPSAGGIERDEGASVGDANDRFLLRLREISTSVDLLKQAAEGIPSGEFNYFGWGEKAIIPSGEAYSRVETSRGLLGCHVVSDGGPSPTRIQFRPPSLAHFSAIPELVKGIRLEDLPVLLATLDPGISEADR